MNCRYIRVCGLKFSCTCINKLSSAIYVCIHLFSGYLDYFTGSTNDIQINNETIYTYETNQLGNYTRPTIETSYIFYPKNQTNMNKYHVETGYAQHSNTTTLQETLHLNEPKTTIPHINIFNIHYKRGKPYVPVVEEKTLIIHSSKRKSRVPIVQQNTFHISTNKLNNPKIRGSSIHIRPFPPKSKTFISAEEKILILRSYLTHRKKWLNILHQLNQDEPELDDEALAYYRASSSFPSFNVNHYGNCVCGNNWPPLNLDLDYMQDTDVR